MLEEGRRRSAAGQDVVIGYLGRGRGLPEPSADLERVPALAEEVDVEALARRAPAAVLVDGLAGTNAAGATNRKRFQDVLELLGRGIDVITTVNLYELEQRRGYGRGARGGAHRRASARRGLRGGGRGGALRPAGRGAAWKASRPGSCAPAACLPLLQLPYSGRRSCPHLRGMALSQAARFAGLRSARAEAARAELRGRRREGAAAAAGGGEREPELQAPHPLDAPAGAGRARGMGGAARENPSAGEPAAAGGAAREPGPGTAAGRRGGEPSLRQRDRGGFPLRQGQRRGSDRRRQKRRPAPRRGDPAAFADRPVRERQRGYRHRRAQGAGQAAAPRRDQAVLLARVRGGIAVESPGGRRPGHGRQPAPAALHRLPLGFHPFSPGDHRSGFLGEQAGGPAGLRVVRCALGPAVHPPPVRLHHRPPRGRAHVRPVPADRRGAGVSHVPAAVQPAVAVGARAPPVAAVLLFPGPVREHESGEDPATRRWST